MPLQMRSTIRVMQTAECRLKFCFLVIFSVAGGGKLYNNNNAAFVLIMLNLWSRGGSLCLNWICPHTTVSAATSFSSRCTCSLPVCACYSHANYTQVGIWINESLVGNSNLFSHHVLLIKDNCCATALILCDGIQTRLVMFLSASIWCADKYVVQLSN